MPLKTNVKPNNDAIPAATIPLGPTQLINIFSLNVNADLYVLSNTPMGRIIKTTTAKRANVSHL